MNTALVTAYLLILFRFLFKVALRQLRKSDSYVIAKVSSNWKSLSMKRITRNPKRDLIMVWKEDIDEIDPQEWSLTMDKMTKEEAKTHVENMGLHYKYNDSHDNYPDDGISGKYCPTLLTGFKEVQDPASGRVKHFPKFWYVVEPMESVKSERFRLRVVDILRRLAEK